MLARGWKLSGNIKHPRVIPASASIMSPMMVMMVLIVALSILIVQVSSKSVTVNTTSGQLLGIQADGGMCLP